MSKKVLVPIADGSEEMEAVCIIDTLRRADADVTVASVSQNHLIIASRSVKLVADTLISDCKGQTFDLIVLPGGITGAENLRDCDTLIDMLKQQQSSDRLYAAICASPAIVFDYHGLLDNKDATCHPSFLSKLQNTKPIDRPVVVHGNCITSQGPATALHFAIKLVELLYDKEKADQIADAMLVE